MCPPKGTNVHVFLPFELFLRQIWHQDRTKNYMRLTGAKSSTAKHRVSGRRDPDYAEIIAIVRSDFGLDWLRHAMGDANPKWWRNVRKAQGIGQMRRELAEHGRRLAQIEMEID